MKRQPRSRPQIVLRSRILSSVVQTFGINALPKVEKKK